MTGVCVSHRPGQDAAAHAVSVPAERDRQRIKVEHWIPIAGNAVLRPRSCTNATDAECTRLQSPDAQPAENSSSIIIKSLNSSIVNLADNIGKLSERVNEQQRQLELADKRRTQATEAVTVGESAPALAILVDSSILPTTIATAADEAIPLAKQQPNIIAVMSDTAERMGGRHVPLPEQPILIEAHSGGDAISSGNRIDAPGNGAASERIVHVITGIELSKSAAAAPDSGNATKTVCAALISDNFNFTLDTVWR